MNIFVVVWIVVIMIGLKFTRLNILGWLIVWWISIYIFLRFGIDPPPPSSLIAMFMAIVTLALLAYLSASTDYMLTAKRSLVAFLADRKYTFPLVMVIIALPALAAFKAYMDATEPPQPPASGRTIHPSPPQSIEFTGKTIDLVNGVNPYRKLETGDPEKFRRHVENGRRVYYENCVFCHGDNMAGKGIFAHGFDPIPANFQDPTTIAMLQETYLFWRIAKGGPGLPPQSTPWSSAMPAWEEFLSEEEIWDVILFLYDFTGQKPRAREEIH